MANTYGKVSGTFQEIDNAYGKVSGTWQEADEIYAKVAADAVDTTQLVNDAVTAAKLERKFTISTSSPSGGNDGDIWFKYS